VRLLLTLQRASASISNDWEAGLGTGRLQRTPAALVPESVPPELQPHAVTAEVFENQRLQVGMSARGPALLACSH
jgi:hypothetical protein